MSILNEHRDHITNKNHIKMENVVDLPPRKTGCIRRRVRSSEWNSLTNHSCCWSWWTWIFVNTPSFQFESTWHNHSRVAAPSFLEKKDFGCFLSFWQIKHINLSSCKSDDFRFARLKSLSLCWNGLQYGNQCCPCHTEKCCSHPLQIHRSSHTQ